MKYIVGIQTAEFPNSVALLKVNGDVVDTIMLRKREKTVELLGKSLQKLIKKAGIKIKDISLISVCLGPGSYTGTRGGLAFAKGFCQFTKIPLIGVSAFEVLEQNVENVEQSRNVIFLLDARNKRVFYAEMKAQVDEKQIKVDTIITVIDKISRKTLFIGSGALANQRYIKGELKEKASFVKKSLNLLTAEQTARAGLKKFKEHDSIYKKDYLYKIKPLYILPPNITKPN